MNLWWLVPPLMIAAWYVGYQMRHFHFTRRKIDLPRDYFLGLNFLLNEEADKAVDTFIKMLEVDNSTVETHLAVAKLFRRRGEVDRAIRIHQNLVERPHLEQPYVDRSLFELGQDYLSAGMLDRAEKIFLKIINVPEYAVPAMRALLDIYQQEKMWERATQIAYKIEAATKQSMRTTIAHYFCEMAEQLQQQKKYTEAQHYLIQALDVDPQCVRASILQANIDMVLQDYSNALKTLKRVKNQNAKYVSETIDAIVLCFEKLQEEEKLINYLIQLLEEHPQMKIVISLADKIRKVKGDKVAAGFVADFVRRYPSLIGLDLFISIYLSNAEGRARQDLLILQGLMKKLLSDQPNYQCSGCGFSGKHIHWHCPGCKQWNTVQPKHLLQAT